MCNYMKKCTNCNTKFSKRKLVRSAWLGYEKIECANCGAIYEHTVFNRILLSTVSIAPLLLPLIVSEYFDLQYSLLIFLLSVIAFVLLAILIMGYLRFKKIK